jgi:ribonuclease VapC
MIALDTSAVVAIALHEPEEEPYSTHIVERGALIGAPTLLECHIVLSTRMPAFVEAFMRGFVERQAVHTSEFTVAMHATAVEAFNRYGKGRGHRAGLNFGDCMAYAVAKENDLPLLYKGDDFSHTDIRRAAR